jgi:hypothetical protein
VRDHFNLVQLWRDVLMAAVSAGEGTGAFVTADSAVMAFIHRLDPGLDKLEEDFAEAISATGIFNDGGRK